MDNLISAVGFAAFALVLAAGIIIRGRARKSVTPPLIESPKTDVVVEVSEPAQCASYLKVVRSLADWLKLNHELKIKRQEKAKE